MTSRRDVLLGLGLAGVAGSAYALTPRQRVSLLGDAKLDALIPTTVPGWQTMQNTGIIAPPPKGSLADRLYSQSSQRSFENAQGDVVMMLIAYGDTQSDQLQLHRPESCYPAVGFQISDLVAGTLRVEGRDLPIRRMTARLDSRIEQVMYWTRLGEDLPRTAGEQREARFRHALSGIIPDGVLVRFSNFSSDAAQGDAVNGQFIRSLLTALPPPGRRALLGSAFAGARSGHG